MHSQRKILLIDDDPIFLTLAEMVIKKEMSDAEIFKVTNGEEAIGFLQTQSVDTIFLDMNMPVMDGWEFLDELARLDYKGDRVYMLTSSIDPHDQKKATEHPIVTSMLEKPLDQEKVSFALAS